MRLRLISTFILLVVLAVAYMVFGNSTPNPNPSQSSDGIVLK